MNEKIRFFKGRTNMYHCSTCRGYVVTLDIDDGVTPFLIACRATEDCDGMMKSAFYRDLIPGVPSKIVPHLIWRKPTDKELRKASPEMMDHFKNGGLMLAAAPAVKP